MLATRTFVGLAALLGTTVFVLAHEAADHKHAPPDARAVTQCVRTGSGDLTYETVANWCQIPQGKEVLGATHGGIVVDKAGIIYFSMQEGEHGLMVYRPDGTFLRGIAPGYTGMHGLTIREEGGQEYIYAAQLAVGNAKNPGPQALKLKLDGSVVMKIGVPMESGKYKDANQYKPTAIAVAPTGDIYVADGYGQNWIHRFDSNGKYKSSFGGRGKEPGQFQTCHGMGLDTRGEKPLLLIADRENKRLQHFDLDGNFIAVVTENLRRPCSMSFHGDKVAVAELQGRVTILDGDNNHAAYLGDNPDEKQWANFKVNPTDFQEGIFTAPHGVSFDKAGNVYVMDWNYTGRVSKLKLIGE